MTVTRERCSHRRLAVRQDMVSAAGFKWRVLRCPCGYLHEGSMVINDQGDAVRVKRRPN